MAIPLKYNVRNVIRRRGRTALTIGGMAVTVFVSVVTLGIVRCMWDSVGNSASPDNIVILSKRGQNAMQSQIDDSVPALLENLRQLRRSEDGIGCISGELVYDVALTFDEHPESGRFQAFVRGVDPSTAFLVNDRVVVAKEDAARGVTGPAGDGGILVGKNAHIRLGVPREWLEVGKVLWYGSRPDDATQSHGKLTVIGRLDAPGTTFNTEVWFDLEYLKALIEVRQISQITLKVNSAAELAPALAALGSREDVKLDSVSEVDYYSDFYSSMNAGTIMIIMIAIVVCCAGVLVGMNTMYAAVMGRIREIGTLRVLGFTPSSVLASFVFESVLLSATAGVVGTAAGALLPVVARDFEGMQLFHAMFVLSVGPDVAAAGMLISVFMGVVGALPPALAGVRMNVVESLRHA